MLQIDFVNREKERLIAERTQIVEEVAHLRGLIQAEIELDDGDGGIVEREKDSVLLELFQHRLRDIDAALRAIVLGEYGLCQRCHLPIDIERLEARPDASYCLHCQQEVERANQRRYHQRGLELLNADY
jgi:DnaK suppressor protein